MLLYTVVHVLYIKVLQISTASKLRSCKCYLVNINLPFDWLTPVQLHGKCCTDTPEDLREHRVTSLLHTRITLTYACVHFGTSGVVGDLRIVSKCKQHTAV